MTILYAIHIMLYKQYKLTGGEAFPSF